MNFYVINCTDLFHFTLISLRSKEFALSCELDLIMVFIQTGGYQEY